MEQCAHWRIFSPPLVRRWQTASSFLCSYFSKNVSCFLFLCIKKKTYFRKSSCVWRWKNKTLESRHEVAAAAQCCCVITWNLAELYFIACFISRGMCLFMFRGEAGRWRWRGRRDGAPVMHLLLVQIIYWVKHHGQVFINSPGMN